MPLCVRVCQSVSMFSIHIQRKQIIFLSLSTPPGIGERLLEFDARPLIGPDRTGPFCIQGRWIDILNRSSRLLRFFDVRSLTEYGSSSCLIGEFIFNI